MTHRSDVLRSNTLDKDVPQHYSSLSSIVSRYPQFFLFKKLVMDPLSAAPASVIELLSTVLGISSGIFSLIRSIANAPDDLTSLSNELQDLRVILATVELAIKSTDGFEQNVLLLSVLPTVLRRMEDKLGELEQLILSFCDAPQGKMVSLKGLDWTLRGKDKAKRIKDDISSLKWPISTCLSSLSV